MGRVNVLADALKTISNAERVGKRAVMVRPSSNIIIKFLKVMQENGYIQEFSKIDDHRSGKLIVKLNGRLNKCRAISPRYNLKITNLETWVANLLPSRQFGVIVLTTSLGILDHKEALKKKTGGKILGFFY
jgi:small subunit ribosomal protein S15Ae